jgi:hypothetical protein
MEQEKYDNLTYFTYFSIFPIYFSVQNNKREKMQKSPIPIHHKIYTFRDKHIMLDEDLAELYQVTTKRLNEQVKRNTERFPEDFMFQLTEEEYENLRSQFATSSSESHGGRRYMPYAFTENGVYMLSAVLKSQVAVRVSIEIMRTLSKLREFSLHYGALSEKLIELERKNSAEFQKIYALLSELMLDTQAIDEKVMGFLR